MGLEIKFTNQFKKDVKLAKKQGKNLDKLFSVVEQLANKKILDAKYHDHSLSGDYCDLRECHIEPDWLLIYKVHEDILVLMLYRVGSHSNLFN